MKKLLFTLFIIAIAITGLQAQNLQVHKTDGSIITVPLSTIDSITFMIGGTVGQEQPCPGIPTVTDIDGNVYNTVLIGDQCWMKENLKTTQYRNGTPIEYPGTNDSLWRVNTTGAYAWLDNDISFKEKYGSLYNWHAVNNTKGLCPEGWHVPSDEEWMQLVDYVVNQGYSNDQDNPNGAGNTLKSCRQVNSPFGGDCATLEHPRWESHWNHHGFDDFGFSALPGGMRFSAGFFEYIGSRSNWWSSTERDSRSWYWYIEFESGNMRQSFYYKTVGHSVRCLMD